ncbi:MAG: efflux RND transporter periplasmic adaptor subunit [Syntrophobacteraceae bacterium]
MKTDTKSPHLPCDAKYFLILLLCSCLFIIAGCSQNASGKGDRSAEKPAVPVVTAVAVQKDVPVQIKAIGKVQAHSTVAIKAQISGELISVHFKEGQDVKKGDLLFTIDPRPFEAQLKQAEANLARNKAQLLNAQKQVERYGSVVTKGYVSQEQYDIMKANASALEAAVRADEAAAESARLSLKYCYIKAPIEGCTGELKLHAGNIIKANDEEKPLVTINRISPVFVIFSVPEQNLPDIKKHMAAGRLEVLASVSGSQETFARGELTFLDNAVDFSTGTIQLKAEYPNKDRGLWPGQFSNVVLTLSQQIGAVVIPFEAVQTGQQGQYVFVLKPDSSVEYRIVTPGKVIGNETVVDKGIVPGETVVTDGHLRLANGSKVKVVENGNRAE